MLRSLYTAGSGLNSQQLLLDTIANNLANVNTTGYKKNRVNFQDLIYQKMQIATKEKPVQVEVGTGVRLSSTLVDFKQGILQQTGNELDIAIEGQGFFKVQMPNGIGYTRNGACRLDDENYIVNSDGYRLLDESNSFIQVPEGTREIQIENGVIYALVDGEQDSREIGTIGLAVFNNPTGLEKNGGSIYLPTSASGEAQDGISGDVGFGLIKQYFLENSNVNVVEEMVQMITAQRAYEINTKTIQTTDEILQMTNNLRR
ncbi:MAG: flagellar basal-body rod protein FlgG [Clostridia bacterium]|jgi:flagellar basal-body rod protein FlgG|nr:flagellar basal-body rod protein FlgG [Clostridia bacterium]